MKSIHRTWLPASLLALLAGFPAAARANFQTQTESVSLTQTNWANTMVFNQFDPSLGTLTGVTLNLTGQVSGSSAFESLDSTPSTVTMNLQATITLERPDKSSLVATLPTATTVDSVSAFDGSIDFLGTSGRTHAGQNASDVQSVTINSPSPDLALFIGKGTISLPITGVGSSTASGSGNLQVQFLASAGASAVLTYQFATVPEPASMVLFGLGGAAAVVLLRRRPRAAV
jgi:hypothetical protein